jgi:hypothetical protein
LFSSSRNKIACDGRTQTPEKMKMLQKSIQWFLLLTTAVLMSSCYYDEVVPVERKIEVGEVSFKNDLLPIFNKSCNSSGCHSGAVAPNLTAGSAYNSLINGGYINKANPESSELYLWMKGTKSTPMPLSGPNAEYNAKVLGWIKQGALDN